MKYAVNDSCVDLKNEYKVLQLFANLPRLIENNYNIPSLHSSFYVQAYKHRAAVVDKNKNLNINYYDDVSQCYFLEQKIIGAKTFYQWFHSLKRSEGIVYNALSSIAQCFDDINKSLLKLHSFGIVHGDISYSNVLVDDKNHCFLIDFGGAVNVSQLTNPRRGDIGIAQTYLFAHHGWYKWFYNYQARADFRKSMKSEIAEQQRQRQVSNQRRTSIDIETTIRKAMTDFAFQYDKYSLGSMFVQQIAFNYQSFDNTNSQIFAKYLSQFGQIINSLNSVGAENNNRLPDYGTSKHKTLVNTLEELEVLNLDAAINIKKIADERSNQAFQKVAATLLTYVVD